MKIIYCPPGDDPMQLARAARQRSTGGSGLLQENWWVILGVIAFVVIGVTVGPFKGVLQQPIDAAPESAAETFTAPILTPTPPPMCSNPAGGLVGEGGTLWIDHGTEISLYRCENGNLLKQQTLTQTIQTAP